MNAEKRSEIQSKPKFQSKNLPRVSCREDLAGAELFTQLCKFDEHAIPDDYSNKLAEFCAFFYQMKTFYGMGSS